MATELLLREYNSLPKDLQVLVFDFILLLKNKTGNYTNLPQHQKKKTPKAGFGKYKIVVRADFDEPLEEFAQYLQ